jgi:alkylation response protein AidB-like acyl-CoA dehydrogenase
MKITFSATEEQQLLRQTAKKFLSERSTEARIRELMMTDTGFDEAEWAEVAAMGWTAMAIPEDLGGAGYGWAETAVLVEEAGAALWCAPFLSSAVVATAALVEAGGDVATELLPAMAMGEVRVTLAHAVGKVAVTLSDGRLTGTADHVLDGGTAHQLLVPVVVDGAVTALVAVAADADGVSTTSLPVLDLTRKQSTVTFDGAPARIVAEGAAAQAAVDRATVVGAVVCTAEQVGGIAHVLAESVQYGKDRKQFGRAIGSYQALKHRMANTLKELEAARSASTHAVRMLDVDEPEELAIVAPVAISWCGEVFERATHDNIQNLGGIGFTWEHPAHLYYKRAKTDKLLFGGGKAWRSRLADLLAL